MESTLGEHVRLLAEMTLLAVMIAMGISFVFLLAYVDVELAGLRAAWRGLQSRLLRVIWVTEEGQSL